MYTKSGSSLIEGVWCGPKMLKQSMKNKKVKKKKSMRYKETKIKIWNVIFCHRMGYA